MLSFNKPEKLDGTQLRQELRENGIEISDDPKAVGIEGDGLLYLDIDFSNKDIAERIVASHEVKITTNLVDKSLAKQALLNKLGITEEEAKLLLGGN